MRAYTNGCFCLILKCRCSFISPKKQPYVSYGGGGGSGGGGGGGGGGACGGGVCVCVHMHVRHCVLVCA